MSISWPFFWAALKKAAWFVWHWAKYAVFKSGMMSNQFSIFRCRQQPFFCLFIEKFAGQSQSKLTLHQQSQCQCQCHKLRLDRGSCCGLQPEASSSSCKFKSNGKLLVHRDFTHWCQRARRSKSWISFSGAACRRPNSRRHKVPADFAAERVVQPLIPYCQQYYARHAPLVRSMAGY